jgi:hypothetical protein
VYEIYAYGSMVKTQSDLGYTPSTGMNVLGWKTAITGLNPTHGMDVLSILFSVFLCL